MYGARHSLAITLIPAVEQQLRSGSVFLLVGPAWAHMAVFSALEWLGSIDNKSCSLSAGEGGGQAALG